MSFDYLFSYLASLTLLLPFTYCFLTRKKKDKTINTIWFLLSIDLLVQIIAEYYNQVGSRISTVYFNVYPLFQFILISIVYTYLIPHWKRLIKGFIVIYLLFFIVNALVIEKDIRSIQNYPLFIQSFIIVGYSGLHYWNIHHTIEREPPLFSYGPFWITTGFTVYFFFSLGLFLTANQIFEELEPASSRMIWNFHALNYIAKNVLLAVGIRLIWKAKDGSIDYKKYGEAANWREHMKPNPHLENEGRSH